MYTTMPVGPDIPPEWLRMLTPNPTVHPVTPGVQLGQPPKVNPMEHHLVMQYQMGQGRPRGQRTGGIGREAVRMEEAGNGVQKF